MTAPTLKPSPTVDPSPISRLIDAMRDLSSAEDFFAFFELPFDAAVLRVNRLHIMKRFNQYLARSEWLTDEEFATARARAASLLARAYDDFVGSSAQEQKVFPVFHRGTTRISVDSLKRNAGSQEELSHA